MDPPTITVPSMLLAAATTKCVDSLIEWTKEVNDIAKLTKRFWSEIDALQCTFNSLETTTADKALVSAVTNTCASSGELLWSQVNMTIKHAQGTLEALDCILNTMKPTGPGVSPRDQRHFKMSLQSGEIAALRRRIVLLKTTLRLPLQMLNIQLQMSGMTADTNAAAEAGLSDKIEQMQSAIGEIRKSILCPMSFDQASGSSSDTLYTHVSGIADIAQGFASVITETSVKGDNLGSPAGTVSAQLSARRGLFLYRGLTNKRTTQEDGKSVAGEASPFDEDLPSRPRELMSWAPTSQPIQDAKGGGNLIGSIHLPTPSSSMEKLSVGESVTASFPALDLDLELHQRQLGKGLAFINSDKFDNAVQALSSMLMQMGRERPSKDANSVVDEAKLLLARAQIGQKNDGDAETTLRELLETLYREEDALSFSVKHYLAEIAARREDLNLAKHLALEAANGRGQLFGPNNSAYHESVNLLAKIVTELEEADEAKLSSSLLPESSVGSQPTGILIPISPIPTVSVADRFIKCQKEISVLLQGGQVELAVSTGLQFLKDHYNPIPPYHCELYKGSCVKWDEIASNIRSSDGRGFLGWTSGMCAAHFLAMADLEAITEMDYLLSQGLDIAMITELPPPSLKDGQDYDKGCTLLMTAAFVGNTAMVECLLRHGAVASKGDTRTEKTALAYAAAAGDLESMRHLHSKATNESSESADNAMALAMNAACQRDQMDAILWLLDHGGNVKGRGWLGAMPIHAAASGGSIRLMSLFLSRGCDLSETDEEGWGLTSYAGYFGKNEALKFLIAEGASISVKDKDGRTALLHAAEGGSSDAFLTLISSGANVDEVDNDGENALTLASSWCREDFVTMLFTKYPSQSFKWLFAEGGTNPPVHAAVSAKNVAFLRLLFDFAFDAPVDDDPSSTPGRPRYVQRSRNFARVKRLILTSDNDGWTPLHIAASNDSPECLQALLYQMGPLGPASLAPDIDVPLEPTRETPLHRAASGEQLECAKLLLSRGASVLVQDHNGASAAHWAAWGGDAEILGLIMDMCIRETGSSRFTVHQSLRNDWGALPLHYAAGEGETNCARRLVECYGAYAMEQNNEGDTPVHIAARKGHTETLKFLLSSLPDLQGYLDVARQSGHTPLMDAALDDKPECVALLLKHGASPLVEKRVGPPGELPGMTAAHFAAANSVSSLKIILSHTPLERFDRPRKSTQTTLLATACDNGQEDCVTLLLERGVTPLRAFPRNGVACSALSVAAVSNRGSLVRLLCQASARERPDDWIEWFNQNLHFDVVLLTAGNGKTEALEALMDFGFDMRTARKLSGAMNMKPMTPFAIASQEKKQNVLDLLKKHGITS